MKKARIALAAIAVIGIVGGSLAFKAAKFGGTTFYTTGTAGDRATATITGVLTTSGTKVYYTETFDAVAPAANFSAINAQQ